MPCLILQKMAMKCRRKTIFNDAELFNSIIQSINLYENMKPTI